jgi:hypothetical protein
LLSKNSEPFFATHLPSFPAEVGFGPYGGSHQSAYTRPEKLRSIGSGWATNLDFNSAFRRQPFRAREAVALGGKISAKA